MSTFYSMTGYGRELGRLGSEKESSGATELEIEIKSVNSRFLDAKCRLPNSLSHLEPGLLEILKSNIARGRVDLTVTLSAAEQTSEKSDGRTIRAERRSLSGGPCSPAR